MEDLEFSNKTTSVFNDGVLQIQRLHNIWLDVRKNRESGEFDKAKGSLMSAYVELSSDIEILDNDKGKKEFIIVKDGKIEKKEMLRDDRLKELDVELDKAASKIKRVEVYNLLVQKEIILRKIQFEAGKGGKHKNVEEDDFD